MNDSRHNRNNRSRCTGIVLLIMLVLLVVLSTLGYTLTARVASQRHRDRYIIDYQQARYACDSGAKYALATLEGITPLVIARPNEPDFSDLFALNETEYQQLLEKWAEEYQRDRFELSQIASGVNGSNELDLGELFSDVNDINDVNDLAYGMEVPDFNDPNFVSIPGPYGPAWPFITEPIEFEIGTAVVRIEIEDENAKYPLGWALLEGEQIKREVLAGFETFCEWMNIDEQEIDSLKKQLKEISEIKSFKLKPKPIQIKASAKPRPRPRRRTRRSTRKRTKTKTIPASVHVTDFAELFHSSLIDTELLARASIDSESRKESALKYMGMWASERVNINTAPRQVLEAAFTFGGDADKIAEEIIQRRRTKPFSNIGDLKKSLLRYSESITKCEKYITTVSRFFTIKVTAVSGAAKVSTIIAVTKDGEEMLRIASVSG